MQGLQWLSVSLQPTSLKNTQVSLDAKFLRDLLVQMQLEPVQVVQKPRPYQNQCFVQMPSLMEAAIVRMALENKVVKEHRVIFKVRFFGPPTLAAKVCSVHPSSEC